MPVHQFATSLTYGDAISDEMLEIRKALRRLGHASEIFVRFFDPRLAHLVRDYREYRRHSSPSNTVIFHFSIGSPVSKMFFRIPDRKVMVYHNITPYEFFLDNHRILTRECYKGRLELRLFKDKVDLALGDSEYNRRELEEAGYVEVTKTFENRMPKTRYRLTDLGRERLDAYWQTLDEIRARGEVGARSVPRPVPQS